MRSRGRSPGGLIWALLALALSAPLLSACQFPGFFSTGAQQMPLNQTLAAQETAIRQTRAALETGQAQLTRQVVTTTQPPAPAAPPPALATEDPSSPTPTLSPTPDLCLGLITPAHQAVLPAAGDQSFAWNTKSGALSYRLEIITPAGSIIKIETESQTYILKLDTILWGGQYIWKVTAISSDRRDLCTSGAITFDKPEGQPRDIVPITSNTPGPRPTGGPATSTPTLKPDKPPKEEPEPPDILPPEPPPEDWWDWWDWWDW